MLFDPTDAPEEEPRRVEEAVERKPVGPMTAAALALAISMALWLLIYIVVLLVRR